MIVSTLNGLIIFWLIARLEFLRFQDEEICLQTAITLYSPQQNTMISYSRFTLSNGLRVIVQEDASTPLACINILYDVGARDESPEQTGFAHLFEHLMFGGSVNIPSYDSPLQEVGGENNAFTNNDITNYYLTLPAANIETGFWLESDRMLSLAFSDKSLEVQRNVVIEEFKQRYLNQPYGDEWLLLRPLAYKEHPYRWATIGKEIKHIEDAKIEDVKAFFHKHYHPGNAIMVVAGNVKEKEVKELAEKWFGPIPATEKATRNIVKIDFMVKVLKTFKYNILYVKLPLKRQILEVAFLFKALFKTVRSC